MTHADKLARADALTDALRIADEVIGNAPPSDQALRIIDAIKRLRGERPARVVSLERRDYLREVREAARAAWTAEYDGMVGIGPGNDATAGIDTPLGRLAATVWRQRWDGQHRERIVWAGSYTLNGEPITIAEIREADLALRPTSRNRQKGPRN